MTRVSSRVAGVSAGIKGFGPAQTKYNNNFVTNITDKKQVACDYFDTRK